MNARNYLKFVNSDRRLRLIAQDAMDEVSREEKESILTALIEFLDGEGTATEDEEPKTTRELVKTLAEHKPVCEAESSETCPYENKLKSQIAENEKAERGDRLGGSSAPQKRSKRDELKGRLEKKGVKDADAVVDELLKIGDPKTRKAALHWVMKGSVRLPEDMPKVEQALSYTVRAKGRGNIDPMSYDSPMAMMDALHEFKPKEKPISVADLKKNPLMSDYRDEGYGVETFEVDDSRDGQQLMREVINTHWGEDANPWCLLHGDGKGKLSDGSDGGYDAYHYWQHYNALPKRVAFKDGKLLAFMATALENSGNLDDVEYRISNELNEEFNSFLMQDGNEDVFIEDWLQQYHPDVWDELVGSGTVPEQWWDRQDESHDGIPLGKVEIEGDSLGRSKECELFGGMIVPVSETMFKTEADGTKRAWYGNGQIMSESLPDGTNREWYGNGQMKYERLPDGTLREWHESGQIRMNV